MGVLERQREPHLPNLRIGVVEGHAHGTESPAVILLGENVKRAAAHHGPTMLGQVAEQPAHLRIEPL